VGVSLVIGYALLGSTWLIMKTQGPMQERCFALAAKLGAGTILCIGLVSLATPFLSGAYYERWFSWPQILFTAQVPLLVAVVSVGFFVSLRRRLDHWPFLLAVALFGLCLAGLGISIYPEAVPGAVTIHDAAAPRSSLIFMLVGFLLLIPIILAYTGYSYWVFRGKTSADEGYH
jgi:cytochrome d ubiquinol oxidase subunit II